MLLVLMNLIIASTQSSIAARTGPRTTRRKTTRDYPCGIDHPRSKENLNYNYSPQVTSSSLAVVVDATPRTSKLASHVLSIRHPTL